MKSNRIEVRKLNSKHHERYQVKITGILVLLLFPLIPPDYLQSITLIENISVLMIGIMFLYLFVLSFIKREFNFFVIVSFIYIIWRSYSSYYYSNGVLDLVNSFRIVTLILLLNLIIKRFPKSTLKALSILFGLYVLINFFTLLILPEGLYLDNPREGQFREAWFLGIENQFAVTLIPGVILIVLYSWYSYNKITKSAWINIIITFFTILKVWSATAIVSVAFVIGSMILNLRKRIRPIYRFSLLSLIYIILWVVLVRFNSLESFQTVIVDILEKDMTLSGRTKIWAVMFDSISDSFWYGFGINTSLLVGVHTYFGAHNMILQILIDSGLIGLILFIFCILIAGIKLQKFKNNRISTLLLIGLFGVLIGGLTESYKLNNLFLLLTLSYNIGYLDNKKM